MNVNSIYEPNEMVPVNHFLLDLAAFLAGAAFFAAFFAGAFLTIFLVFSAFLATFLGLAALGLALAALTLGAFAGLTALAGVLALAAFAGLAGEAGAGGATTGAGVATGVALAGALALVALVALGLTGVLDYVIMMSYSRSLCCFGHCINYKGHLLFFSFIIPKNTKCNLIGYIKGGLD